MPLIDTFTFYFASLVYGSCLVLATVAIYMYLCLQTFGLCGYYLRATTIRGRRPFEEIRYVTDFGIPA